MMIITAIYSVGVALVSYGAWVTRKCEPTTVAGTVKYAVAWPFWLVFFLITGAYFAFTTLDDDNPMSPYFKD